MKNRPAPAALPHGEIREIFDDVFFVTGTTRMPGPVAVTCSRNMTILRQGGELTLVNSVRLDEAGLASLEKLGVVRNVIRIAGFHGMDDAFYHERFGAKVWAITGQVYSQGFAQTSDPQQRYFEPGAWIDDDTVLPVVGTVHRFNASSPPEAVLLLPQQGGVLIAGDSLQNWAPDPYFNLLARVMFRLLGFFKPFNVGPGWLKQAKPSASGVHGILDLEWDNVLPAHGSPVLGGAKRAFEPAIRRVK